MKFKVYHAKEWSLNSDLHFIDDEKFCEKNFPYWVGGYKPIVNNYKIVADVETDCIGNVFQLTNHIDHSWQENQEVIAYTDKARSTSVGDLIEDENCQLWMVASCGFEKVEWYIGQFKKFINERGCNYLIPLTHDEIRRLNMYQILLNEVAEFEEVDEFDKKFLKKLKRKLIESGIMI